jgi:hypothetical protein
MNSKIESATREPIKETGSYVQFHIYRVPKKNHDAMVQVNKQILSRFEKQGGRAEFFQLNNRGLVYFDAWKNHIGFYLTPSGIEAFKKELGPFKQEKGSIQFPLDKPIPYDLVKKIVRYRVTEILEKGK